MRVIDVPGHTPDTRDNLTNDAVREAMEALGIEYLVTLPESPYEVMLKDLINSSSMKIIQVCREPEGISISSGLSYGGKKTAMICSFKGAYNSIDSVLGTAVRTQSSFLWLISEAGGMAKSGGDLEGGTFTADILKAIKIPFYEVLNNEDIPKIKQAWEQTRNSTKPVAVILRW